VNQHLEHMPSPHFAWSDKLHLSTLSSQFIFSESEKNSLGDS
jgi:hypothetical protein